MTIHGMDVQVRKLLESSFVFHPIVPTPPLLASPLLWRRLQVRKRWQRWQRRHPLLDAHGTESGNVKGWCTGVPSRERYDRERERMTTMMAERTWQGGTESNGNGGVRRMMGGWGGKEREHKDGGR